MAFKMRMCGSCRRAHPELPRGLSHAKQLPLDPSWTRRFVFLRCGMGDSWIRAWCRLE